MDRYSVNALCDYICSHIPDGYSVKYSHDATNGTYTIRVMSKERAVLKGVTFDERSTTDDVAAEIINFIDGLQDN